MYQYVDGGERYLLGEWPEEDTRAFDPEGAVAIYDERPRGRGRRPTTRHPRAEAVRRLSRPGRGGSARTRRRARRRSGARSRRRRRRPRRLVDVAARAGGPAPGARRCRPRRSSRRASVALACRVEVGRRRSARPATSARPVDERGRGGRVGHAPRRSGAPGPRGRGRAGRRSAASPLDGGLHAGGHVEGARGRSRCAGPARRSTAVRGQLGGPGVGDRRRVGAEAEHHAATLEATRPGRRPPRRTTARGGRARARRAGARRCPSRSLAASSSMVGQVRPVFTPSTRCMTGRRARWSSSASAVEGGDRRSCRGRGQDASRPPTAAPPPASIQPSRATISDGRVEAGVLVELVERSLTRVHARACAAAASARLADVVR